MKIATSLLLLAFSASINIVYANEESTSTDDFTIYCTEQAELAGIEDKNELNLYVQDCVASFTGSSVQE